jgi:hypothetical protein
MTEPEDGASRAPGELGPDADAAEDVGPGELEADDAEYLGPEADTDETVVDESVSDAGAATGASAATTRRPMRPAERRAARTTGKTAQLAPTPSQQAVHVEDRASRFFVLIAVGVFVLILLNALLLGHGGLLAPVKTPAPIPVASAGPSAASPPPSAAPSAAPSASASAGASPSVTIAPSPAAS